MKRLLSIFMMIGLLCHGQLVKNSSFEQGGKDLADGWTLSAQPGGVSEDGAVAGKRAAYVVGNGNDSV
ncbi:MAG: hypothetical protein IKS92_03275, partial [Victivallales bacterium]|nr:hypothetical protein [Victivallales bacterium]